jgi:two-component system OmpR family sensor kinase
MWRRFRKFPSITARLIVGLTLATTLLWCGAVTYSSYTSYHELDETFDRTLRESAQHLLPLAADSMLGNGRRGAHEIYHFIEGRNEYFSFQLRDPAGRIVMRSHDAPLKPYNQTPRPGFSTVGDYRLYTDTDDTTGLTLTVAETTKGRREAVFGGAEAMLWPLLALIPLNVLAIWLTVRGAMKPVLRLSGDIATRSANNLAPLDISDQPRELRPIAEAVARLVERLSAALDAERAFAANSAHELRTPIAGALARTQRMIAELGDPNDRRHAREVESTLKRLSDLAEKLMQLSRVDAGLSVADRQVDLIPVLDLVVDDCAKRLEEPARIHYVKPAGARLLGRVDMDAFAIVVRNLIDNAVNHGAAGGRIDVQVSPDGSVRVANEGPVVPPEVLAGLKRRFVRGESRSAGAGLGLAIVETILSQTGGNLELFSPTPGRNDGFEARVNITTLGRGEGPEPPLIFRSA